MFDYVIVREQLKCSMSDKEQQFCERHPPPPPINLYSVGYSHGLILAERRFTSMASRNRSHEPPN